MSHIPVINFECFTLFSFTQFDISFTTLLSYQCSAECGRGMRMRQVTCENSEGFEVPASFCDKENEPKHHEDCTAKGECKPRWQATMKAESVCSPEISQLFPR